MFIVVTRYAAFARPSAAHAARIEVTSASAAPRVAPSQAAAPANDAEVAAPLPTYALTDALRGSLRKRALALPAAQVVKLPAFVDARIVWMGGIHATAWHDRATLVGLEIDGTPILQSEFDDVGHGLEYAREVCVQRSVNVPFAAAVAAPTAPSELADEAIEAELSGRYAVLGDALSFRFAKQPQGRSVVRQMRGERSGAGLARNGVRVLTLCQDPAVEAWLRRLPKGEGHALDRVRALHPEWCRRIKDRESAGPQPASASELAQRVWTLTRQPFDRILRAGRYLVKRDAARAGAYPGFRAPRAPAVAKPVAAPPGDATPVPG